MKWLPSLFLTASFAVSLFFMGTESGLFALSLVALIAAALLTLTPTGRGLSEDVIALPRSGTVICLLLFWLWLGVSTLWSTVPYNSLLFFFILSALPLTFFVCREKQSSKGTYFTLIILALWAIIQFVFLRHNPAYGYRIHHPMMDPNSLAAFFALGLFPALGWLAATKNKTIAAFALVLLFAAGMLVTQSRGAMLGSALALIPFLLVAGRAFWKKAGTLAGTGAIIGLTINTLTDNRLIKSLGDIVHVGKTVSGGDRLELWQSTFKLIDAHPWGGTGLGTFYYYYPQVRSPNDHSDGFFAHCDPLQFWAETGIAAPILFYALALAIAIRTVKALRAVPNGQALRLKIIAPFCAMAAVFIHTHFTFHFYMLSILIATGAMLALWYAATEDALGEKRRTMPRPVKIGSVIALLTAMLWLMKAGLGTMFATKANDMILAKNFPAAQTMLDHAAFWAPESFYRVPQYEARLHALQAQGKDKEQQTQDALQLLGRAQRLNPVFPQIQYDRALILANAGRSNDAIQIYKTILQADPLYLEARVDLAELYMRQGRFAEAKTALDGGLVYPMPRTGILAVKYLVMTAQAHRMRGDQQGYELLMDDVRQRVQ